MSKIRLTIFEQSFQQHFDKTVQEWYKELNPKRVTTQANLNTITTWIKNWRYNDQNDVYRKQVSNLL